MSKRYICSRCGKQSDAKHDRHLMEHKVHPAIQPPIWIDLDWLNNLQAGRRPGMTRSPEPPKNPR